MPDFNQYVGLPYVRGGRDRAGIDCWGLVRLVHAEQFGNDLPSFADSYDLATQRDELAELVAQQKEAWQPVDEPIVGDVIVLRVEGAESHLGVVVEPGRMLHALNGVGSAIESYTGGKWHHRVSGFFRYAPGMVIVSAKPHPLRAVRIDDRIPAGLSIRGMVDHYARASGWPAEVPVRGVAFVDGAPVPTPEWELCIPTPGARVELRVIAGDSGTGRMIAMIAVAFAAWYFAPLLVGGSAGGMAALSGGALLGAQIGAAVLTVAGSMLVNAIFPIRMPEGGSVTAIKPAWALSGGANQLSPYGAIPVVLGQYRFTGLLGNQPWIEQGGADNYLRQTIVWGYGPLQIEDIRVGNTAIADLEGVQLETTDGATAPSDDFWRLAGSDANFTSVNVKLEKTDNPGADWIQRTTAADADTITVMLSWPQGIGGLDAGDGDEFQITSAVSIQIRPTGSSTWVEGGANIYAREFSAPQDAKMNSNGTFTYRQYFGAITVDQFSNVIFRTSRSVVKLPVAGEVSLYSLSRAAGQGSPWVATDLRDSTKITGCALTITGDTLSVASGTRTYTNALDPSSEAQGVAISIFGNIKVGFNRQATFNVPRGQYDVRVRVTTKTEDVGDTLRRAAVYLVGIRSHTHQKPIAPPKKLAMTAVRVRASNQINGQIEGINAVVKAVCKDWNGSAWVDRPTRNPASLFRHVLQHPANARAITDAEIDLTALQSWHAFCAAKGFVFDHVLTGHRPMLDVLRDIAAAGRASPSMIDGKWTVVVDEVKSTIAQHFTPHNSWGFEGSRMLPKVPHALRVNFVNADKDYQPDERIVYDDGYDAATATNIEQISLPGVSESDAVYRHGRFHLAQIKLRPEEYSLYCDIEHIVCNRGDRVKVTHDVPMWGVGSGRIKTYTDSTHIIVDEPWPMVAATQYTIRIRLEDGSTITRTVAAVGSDGYYTALTLTTSITATEGKPGNLVMFGSLNAESVDCLVKSIEPADNLSARLTLVDYAPGVFTADTEEIPAWTSQITQAPVLARRRVETLPVVTEVISDERVLEKVGPRTWQANIQVSWAQPSDLVTEQLRVEVQTRRADGIDATWVSHGVVPAVLGGYKVGPVEELGQYDIRVRYVSDLSGMTSDWAIAATAHTVIGKTTPPSPVDRWKVIEQPGGIKQYLWQLDTPPSDLLAFEIAYSFGTTWRPWEQMIPLAAKDPLARTHETQEPVNDGAYTFAIRCVDAGGLASPLVYHTEVLDGDQFGNPVKVVVPHELDWPGTKTDCGIDGTALVGDGSLTWNDFDIAWTGTEAGWRSAAAQTIRYEHSVIDMGLSAAWTIRANALVGGSSTLEIATSADNITYSAWGAVPSGAVTTRYIKYRISVTGVDPIIYRAQIVIYG